MARKKEIEVEKTETEIAEENLKGVLSWCIEYEVSHGPYYDEEASPQVTVHSNQMVDALRDAVKCWVKDALKEMEEEHGKEENKD